MNETALAAGKETGQSESGQEYVTFSVDNEFYAIDAKNVQEIIEMSRITKVPHLPDYMNGVINLRGTIIPVVDLKMKFGMGRDTFQKHTCIIVTEFSGGVMGVIVDAVSDVMMMAEDTITATPSFGSRIKTDFIRGMGRVGDSLLIVLDVDRVLSDEEVAVIKGATENIEGAAEKSQAA